MPGSPATGTALTATQARKLKRLLRHALRHVPLYRELYAPLDLRDEHLGLPRTLRRLPLLSKDTLVRTPACERIDSRLDPRSLIAESTTGSTGEPFTLYQDRQYVFRRNLRFLRALLATGYRPWERLLLLTDRHPGSRRRRNWHYESVEQPTDHLVAACRRVRPGVLYGFATPLRLLAERLLEERGPDTPRPRFVISTAEVLDATTRQTIERAFACPVFDFYGMTETGLAAWQHPGLDGYAVADNAVVLELLPDAGCEGRYRVLVTNLDLLASPIIRFDCGDLAYAEPVGNGLRIRAFEGRRIDAIVCRDGTALSPYRVTDALRDVPGLRRFRIVQTALARFDVELESDESARDGAVAAVRQILAERVGAGLTVSIAFRDRLISDGMRKFRPVESRVARPAREGPSP